MSSNKYGLFDLTYSVSDIAERVKEDIKNDTNFTLKQYYESMVTNEYLYSLLLLKIPTLPS